jgi:hypothetical protein
MANARGKNTCSATSKKPPKTKVTPNTVGAPLEGTRRSNLYEQQSNLITTCQ